MTDQMSGEPRILHVVTSDVSTRLMRGQMAYLRKRGYSVHLACSPGKGLDVAVQSDGIQGCPIPMARELSPWKDMVAFWRLCRLMRRLRPSLTNVSTPKAGLLAGLAAFVNRVPCRIYTLRGLRWETLTGLKRRILIAAEWVACHCAHRVICVSHNLRSQAIASGIVPADKAVVLGNGSSNGVNWQRFSPCEDTAAKAAALRRRLGIEADAPVVGFVGRFTRDKGIQELYDAHKILRREFANLRLLLVGDFEQGDPVSETLRKELRNDPSVLCPGFMDDPSDFYHVFDLLAHPSHREGFPNVVLEAQAAEKPAVGALATGTADAILNGVTGFLVPLKDPTALAGAIATLLHNAAMRKKMGWFARARVMERYASERIWEALAGQYHDLLSRKGLAVPQSSAGPEYVPAASPEAAR
jgi:glycosyltransferase involved in cell wall biosynthesis